MTIQISRWVDVFIAPERLESNEHRLHIYASESFLKSILPELKGAEGIIWTIYSGMIDMFVEPRHNVDDMIHWLATTAKEQGLTVYVRKKKGLHL